MAWGEVKVEDRRKEFIEAYHSKQYTLADLCRQYEISRKNAYKWIKRFDSEGINGLKDKSRAPLAQKFATDKKLVERILEVRLRFSTWGPKKVFAYLNKHHPDVEWPSKTTIGNIFDRNGLTVQRKYRRRVPLSTTPLSHCQQPNDVWCIDFKGHFFTQNGEKCDPLTITDACSRYLIRCVKLDFNRTEYVWGILKTCFREYGLPLFLRSDNGAPFGSCAPGRLTKLAINLIKAGVMPEWIEPGKPQQNGRHERMHLTLNETIEPIAESIKEQQIRFNDFQYYYNFMRPHESLNQKSPSEVYKASPRIWDGCLRPPEYSDNQQKRKVMKCGCIGWKNQNIFISEVLYGEYVGLTELSDETYELNYGPIKLGIINKYNSFEVLGRRIRKRKAG